MAEDWFRRKTWTPKDREEFFARLRRSRGAFHKAQYARIQAYVLLETRTAAGYKAALELLDMILAEWREDAQLAAVFHHQAECFLGLGDVTRSVEAYRRVFQEQRVCKGYLTGAQVEFSWLVATNPIPELYEEAWAVLREFGHGAFPIERYRASGSLALILEALGQRERAQGYARTALQEAAAGHSGFRHHATFGLVKSVDEKAHEKLQALAAP